LLIREANAGDARALAALHVASWRAVYRDHMTGTPLHHVRYVRAIGAGR
jgi:hypothetical protein